MQPTKWTIIRLSIAAVGSLLALAPTVQQVAAQIPTTVT